MRKHFFSFLIVMLAAGTLVQTALAQGGRFNGAVVDEEGNPLQGARLVVENPDANPPRLEQVTDSRGRFTLLGMNSGAWTVTVEIEGFHPNTTMVRLRQGDNPPMVFDMSRIKHPLEIALGEAAVEGLDLDVLQAEFEAGDAAYNSQQWEQALTLYRSVVSKLPGMNTLRMNIGLVLRQLGRFEEALASYEAALAGDPGLAESVETEIARTRILMGDFEAADALAVAGGEGASREDFYNLGEVEFARGDVDAAAEWYEKSSAADPNWVKPLFKLALVALNKGDMETAKQFFSQVVEKDPSSEEGAQAKATLSALP